MQIALIASVLVASALANPAGPPPSYHPAPVHGGYKIPPRPFAYAYGVSDEYSGTNFDKKETQVKFRYSEKATKIWFIFHFLFDII